jgi:ketosteroid isomerase-like protein
MPPAVKPRYSGAMSEENVERYRRVVRAYNDGDFEPIIALVDPDVTFRARTSSVEGAGAGHDGVRAWWSDNRGSFADLKLEIDRVLDGGDWVVAQGVSHMRGNESDVALEVPFGHATEWRDGKCVRFESFHTLAEALEAAGLNE